MKSIKNYNNLLLRFTAGMLLFIGVMQCQDPEITTTTTEDVVIRAYFEKNPEEFSEFLKILELSGTSGFLGAYGTYTCFAPTNNAVQSFLQTRGMGTVEEIGAEELKDLVRFHVIEDTLPTRTFTDGRMLKPTMYGQYLITGAVNLEGTSYVNVNRQAKILKGNIRTSNGIIHVIDQVLQPASKTLAELIEQNPQYSIFTQALKETGYYDTLNEIKYNSDGAVRWMTVVGQTDQVFADAGFPDFTALRKRYSPLNTPRDIKDSLHLFVAYRILNDIKYMADLISAPSHTTKAPLEVITTRLENENVRINADIINGKQEPGATLDRELSDFSATNGALHASKNNYAIKVRIPVAVYFDVADQPELRKMTNDFRKPAKNVPISLGTLADVTWGGASTNTIRYFTVSTTSTDPYVYGDYLELNIRTGVIPWVEWTTPLLVKGKYKVWVCYRSRAVNDMQAFFNEEPLPRIFGTSGSNSYPGLPELDGEAQGWKWYTSVNNNTWVGRMVGTIDVKTTDRHKFKIVGLTNRGGGTGNVWWLDMIQFIPAERVGIDQIYPRIHKDGSFMNKP